jgi:uncharacterized protein
MRIPPFLLAILLAGFLSAQNIEGDPYIGLPDPIGLVNDFENILNESQENELEVVLENTYEQIGVQFALVTLPENQVGGKDFFLYTLDLANFWGVGEAGKDNGVLIAISKSLRSIRIQLGYGVEPYISDEETRAVINDQVIPFLKKSDYYEGSMAAVKGIIAELDDFPKD